MEDVMFRLPMRFPSDLGVPFLGCIMTTIIQCNLFGRNILSKMCMRSQSVLEEQQTHTVVDHDGIRIINL